MAGTGDQVNDSAERWHTLEEVFQAALKREPAQREAFLEESCPDADLRREIKSLLDAGASADEILEQPAIRYAFHTLEAGSMLGQYRIEERIGAGGMGEVYRAKDTRLGRAVAIKALPAFYGHDPAWLARFQYEARYSLR
jgi:serine/threonine protein kinase